MFGKMVGFYHRHRHNVCFDFGVDRSDWADKSKAALQREEEAVRKFNEVRITTEAREMEPGARIRIKLLNPDCHLTQSCMKSFNRHVSRFKGWTVRRKAATEEEKSKFKITRKAKVFFTHVFYTAPKEKEKPLLVRSENKAPSFGLANSALQKKDQPEKDTNATRKSPVSDCIIKKEKEICTPVTPLGNKILPGFDALSNGNTSRTPGSSPRKRKQDSIPKHDKKKPNRKITDFFKNK